MRGDSADVRRRVAESYESMLVDEQRPGCCERPAEAIQAMGYEAAQVADLPSDAVANAFGCGSPVNISDMAPGDVVLDLGSGAGIDLLLAADKVGPTGRVIGVDMTDAMIERARANITSAGAGNVEVRKGIIEDLPVDDESVDWVISNCVINLSPDKPRAFAEIARVLKPGGRMRVADIVAEALPEWVLSSPELYNSCIGGAMSEAAYTAGLHDAGLTDVAVGDRYVYDRDTLRGFAADAITAPPDADRFADALVGRIWSIYVSATKPTRATKRGAQ